MNKTFDQFKETEIMEFLTKNFGFEVFTPGLERTRAVYSPYIEYFKQSGVKVITIAGTNGKGQTAHTLASLLGKQGRSYALWTSPHILSIRERFLYGVDGQCDEVSYEDLKSAMDEAFLKFSNELSGVRVSFYEFLFLVFLLIAKKQKKLDYILLEVGLGGRLDAVNHFDADCACITSISRDHQAILGTRYDQILSEKIGVSRRGRALFTNFSLNYLNELTEAYCQGNGILWRPLEKSWSQEHYFKANQRLAWEVFRHFEVSSDFTFETGISHLPLYKGRREIMTFEGKSLIFIGAHNIDGVRKMIASYQEDQSLVFPESLLVSFSQRPLDEIEVMLRSLVDFFGDRAQIELTSFNHPKAMDEASIKKTCEKISKGMLDFVFDWKSEIRKTNSKTILVCGSYYFIGEVQRFIHS